MSELTEIRKLSYEDCAAIRTLVAERVQAMEAYPTLQIQNPKLDLDHLRALQVKLDQDTLWVEAWS